MASWVDFFECGCAGGAMGKVPRRVTTTRRSVTAPRHYALRHFAGSKAGAGNETHQRPVARDGAPADKVQAGYARLEAGTEDRFAAAARQRGEEARIEDAHFRNVDLVASAEQHMVE